MELRKDYILDRWVIISEGREKRPRQFKEGKKQKKVALCYFCPGNEHTTPPEIGRIPQGKNWLIRWFPNKFPAVVPEGDPKTKKEGALFTHSKPVGHHEVIAETPDHDKQLADLSVQHMAKVLKVYSHRITELSKMRNTNYVCVFKNQGESAATSLVHTHTQVVSLSIVPGAVIDEVQAAKSFRGCPYCTIIRREKKSPRFILENPSFVAFAPYASRFNYEVWLFPKKHVKNITEFSEKQYKDCAVALKKILMKIKSLNADYNFVLHYAPEGKDLHFHIEILPRIAKWGGFEFVSNIVINSVSPEAAAKFYR